MISRAVPRIAAILAVGFILDACGTAPAVVRPSSSTAKSVCTPTFQMVDGEFSAGTAFVTRLDAKGSAPSPTVLMTAHHLFGPAGGLRATISWKDLPDVVVSVRCAGLDPSEPPIKAAHPLRVEEARPYSDEGAPRDVAVFPVMGHADYLVLSERAVGRRQPVWLIARVVSGEPSTTLLHAARVTTSDSQGLEFDYENPNLDLTATSGAPIVDARGEVVGINIGGKKGNGRLLGVAQSASILREAVRRALAKTAQPGVAADETSRRR